MNQTNKSLDLTEDIAFKAFFKSSDKILISLLNQFLPLDKNKKIQSVEILNPSLVSHKKKKNPILDLRVRLDDQTSVNIEMQSISKKNFKERVLFYLAKLFTWNLRSGEDYRKINPAYSLIFTNFTVFKEIKDYYTVFQLRSEENPEVVFSRHLGIVLVELTKFKKEGLKDFDLKEVWCYLIKNAKRITERELKQISERGSDMKEAVVRITELSQEESEMMIEEAIEKNRRDKVAELEYARDEGLAQGIVQGKQEGIKEGVEKGIVQGMEKGVEKGMKSAALNMLKKRMDISLVSEITGLSIEEVKKLRK